MADLWQTLIAVVIGGLIAAGGGFAATWWATRETRMKERRAERIQAVEAVWTEICSVVDSSSSVRIAVDREYREATIDQIIKAASTARIRGLPDGVLKRLEVVQKAVERLGKEPDILEGPGRLGHAMGHLEAVLASYAAGERGEARYVDAPEWSGGWRPETKAKIERALEKERQGVPVTSPGGPALEETGQTVVR